MIFFHGHGVPPFCLPPFPLSVQKPKQTNQLASFIYYIQSLPLKHTTLVLFFFSHLNPSNPSNMHAFIIHTYNYPFPFSFFFFFFSHFVSGFYFLFPFRVCNNIIPKSLCLQFIFFSFSIGNWLLLYNQRFLLYTFLSSILLLFLY